MPAEVGLRDCLARAICVLRVVIGIGSLIDEIINEALPDLSKLVIVCLRGED